MAQKASPNVCSSATHPVHPPTRFPILQKSFGATNTPIAFDCFLEHFGPFGRLISEFTIPQGVKPRGLAIFTVMYHKGSPDGSNNLRIRLLVLDH